MNLFLAQPAFFSGSPVMKGGYGWGQVVVAGDIQIYIWAVRTASICGNHARLYCCIIIYAKFAGQVTKNSVCEQWQATCTC